jgi:peptidoglycan/xylan/chitin deacetylase (PgdA/CDA1 family)
MRFYTSVLASAVVALFLTTSDANAHMGKGVPHNFKVREILKPGSGAMTPVRRAPSPAAPTDEPSAATNTVASQECQAYSIPEVAAMKGNYPTVWQTAEIVSGDTEAQNVWTSIQNSGIIPTDVAQKGTGGKGDFSSVTPNYPSSDPDCWYEYHKCVTPKHTGLPEDVWQCPEPDTWGLTFDDGPNCSHNAFYDFLRDNNQKASLFYIGSNVMDWPLEAQRGVVEGHHVCVHTWSHQYMTQLTSEEVFAELYYTGKAIKQITGITARCWRPPYGDVDDRVRAIAQGLGMSTNVWSDDTEDWQIAPQGTLPTASISANYMSIIDENYETHGNIVLTHEINAQTMNMMMKDMYPVIKQHFKNIVPITACMNETNPYPEDITFPNFASYVAGNVMPSGLPSNTSIQVQPSATYDPLAAASETKAAGDSSGGSTSQASHKSNGISLEANTGAILVGSMAAFAFTVLA